MIDNNQLKLKMTRFCAWRERCSHETRQKLIQSGASPRQVKEIIQWLMEENYLNDQRFACSFARGKFAYNHWGKQRISAELKNRQIDPLYITEAIELIDEGDYHDAALMLARKKWKDIREKDPFIKKQKTAAYLASKGFELDMVWKIVEKIQNEL